MTAAAPRRLLALAAATLVSTAVASPALAHASLVSSSPADGAVLRIEDVTSVTLTFDDDLDASKSRFDLVDAGGAVVATGAVGTDLRTMSATGIALGLGAYEARWTAVASDGDLTRGIVGFRTAQDGAVPIAPTASAQTGSGTSGPTDDALLPIAAAAVIVAAVAVIVLRRGRAA